MPFKSPWETGAQYLKQINVEFLMSETKVVPGLFPLQMNTHTPSVDSSVQFENDSI